MLVRSSSLVAALAAGIMLATPAAAHFVTYDGLRFDFHGTADYAFDPWGWLVVNGIGSSGQDGVSITVPQGAAGVLWCWQLEPNAMPTHREITVAGVAGFIDIEILGLGIDLNDDNSLDVTATAQGAPEALIEVVLAGALVQREMVSPATVVHVEPDGPGLQPEGRALTGGSGRSRPERAQIAINQPGVKIVSDSPTLQYIEVTFDGPVRVRFPWLPGGVVGDAIRVARTSGTPIDRLTRAILRGAEDGSELGSFVIWSPGLRMGDGNVRALHDLHLEADTDGDGYPNFTNIGASGQDGIRITPDTPDGRATTFGVTIDELQFVQPPNPASRVMATLTGSAGGGPPAVLANLLLNRSASDLQMVPDFSGVGASSWSANVLDDGVVVAELAGLTGGVGFPSARTRFDWEQLDGPVVRVRVGPRDGVAVPFTFGPATYVGDAVEIVPELSPGPRIEAADYFLKLEITAASLTELEVGDVVVLPGPIGVTAVPDGARARASFALRDAWPNPTRAGAAAELTLGRAAPVRASILDLGGRRVRALHDGAFAAGSHRVTWDGRDDAGRWTAPGLYFIRIESKGAARSVPVVRLR